MPRRPEKKKMQWIDEHKPFDRPRDLSWFYNQRKWKRFSIRFRDANPFCVECMKDDIYTQSEVTDHIRGLGYLLDNNLDAFDVNECQALCQKCHNSKSGKERGNVRKKIKNKGYGVKKF